MATDMQSMGSRSSRDLKYSRLKSKFRQSIFEQQSSEEESVEHNRSPIEQKELRYSFMPGVISFLRDIIPYGTTWDESIYMNSSGVTIVPPTIFLILIPMVFVVSLLFGSLVACVILVRNIHKKDCICTLDFWWDFASIFLGSLTPLLIVFLKFALCKWGGEDDLDVTNHVASLLDLWEANRLSAVELLAPCVLPLFVAAMVTTYVYEFAVARASIYDIGDEFDEHRCFPDEMAHLGEIFSLMHQTIKDESGDDIPRFEQMPFAKEVFKDFSSDGARYAEAWAYKQTGAQHPSAVVQLSSAQSIMLNLFALLPAITPCCWMRWTHQDDYLKSPLKSVLVVAISAFLCLFFVIRALLVIAWKVWQDFVMIRIHLLTFLFLSANSTGRRYITRLWPKDLIRLSIGGFEERKTRISFMAVAQGLRTDPAVANQSSSALPTKTLGKRIVHQENPSEDLRREMVEDSQVSQESHVLLPIICKFRQDAFPKTFQKQGEDGLQRSVTQEAEKEQEMEEWLEENDFGQFQILDVVKFGNTRSCMKPILLLARTRLEATLVGSVFIAGVCIVALFIDFDLHPMNIGQTSCIGIMSVWLFLMFSFSAIICVHTAVLMNMALLDTSVEVLRHWETRIEAVSCLSLKLDHPKLRGTFSDYRVRLQSKFTSMLKPFEKRITKILQEKPLTFACIPITPQWRNRLIVSVVATIVITSGRYLSARILEDVRSFRNSEFR